MQRASRAVALSLAVLMACLSLSGPSRAAEVVPPPLKPEPREQQPADSQPTGEPAALPAQTATSGSEATAPEPAPALVVSLVIGGAPVAGSFFPAAGALCREVNRQQEANGLRCLVEETEGSADNLQQLRDGELDLAIVQSDWAFHAMNGSAADRAPPFTNLYSLMTLQPQLMTLVVGFDSQIATLRDLAGKRVSIGPGDSALNTAARNLLQVVGLLDQITLVELPVEQQVAALCAGSIDAFLLPVAHPSGAVQGAVVGCGARLASLEDPKIDEMVASWPFLVDGSLPAGLYPGQIDAVSSYGTVATLVATDALSDDEAYEIVKAIFEGIEDLKAQHPALALLTEKGMTGTAGMGVPLHPGALRYYTERGWR